ncbi:cytidylyltransferase domain-containing protein [Hymenobacter sp. CRA2]|uniref:cytidylyltransferase domain-containing protein n=1 Tax=Hymenobacter sp. CRA2 TaxID=1955620 RepID=UPI0009C9220F|nr:glycosyltransferase family protein [Hymenobacter sp. CRA2]OON70318.1 acylneuraminate cytidylyltransferase [Hymenobacter sp. CRA2]
MRVGIISQVRMGSTRLPGKVLLPAAGRPLLDYHVVRLQQSGFPVILATSVLPADDALAQYAEQHQLPYHRGSETDVLARYYETAKAQQLDVIARVTSDCPLIDGELLGAALRRYVADASPQVFRSNAVVRTYPRGFDFEIFSFAQLEAAQQQANTEFEREHVTPYLKTRAPGIAFRDEVNPAGDFSQLRLTLDTPEDYELLRRLIEEHHAETLPGPAIVELLLAHPELVAINAHVEQKTT